MYFFKTFRSVNTNTTRSLDKRAPKSLAFKVGGLKRKSAALAFKAKSCASALGPGLTLPEVKSYSKFDGP